MLINKLQIMKNIVVQYFHTEIGTYDNQWLNNNTQNCNL